MSDRTFVDRDDPRTKAAGERLIAAWGRPLREAVREAQRAGARARYVTLPTAYDPGRYVGEGATDRDGTIYGVRMAFEDREDGVLTVADEDGTHEVPLTPTPGAAPLRVGDSLRAAYDHDAQPAADERAARWLESDTKGDNVIPNGEVTRLRVEVAKEKVVDALRPPGVCPACWHRAMSMPSLAAHQDGCEWWAQRQADVRELANTMAGAAPDDADRGDLLAMATRILDAGWAPVQRTHHQGAVEQARYLAEVLAEQAAGMRHSGGSVPHASASDCYRCGVEAAESTIRAQIQ